MRIVQSRLSSERSARRRTDLNRSPAVQGGLHNGGRPFSLGATLSAASPSYSSRLYSRQGRASRRAISSRGIPAGLPPDRTPSPTSRPAPRRGRSARAHDPPPPPHAFAAAHHRPAPRCAPATPPARAASHRGTPSSGSSHRPTLRTRPAHPHHGAPSLHASPSSSPPMRTPVLATNVNAIPMNPRPRIRPVRDALPVPDPDPCPAHTIARRGMPAIWA